MVDLGPILLQIGVPGGVVAAFVAWVWQQHQANARADRDRRPVTETTLALLEQMRGRVEAQGKRIDELEVLRHELGRRLDTQRAQISGLLDRTDALETRERHSLTYIESLHEWATAVRRAVGDRVPLPRLPGIPQALAQLVRRPPD